MWRPEVHVRILSHSVFIFLTEDLLLNLKSTSLASLPSRLVLGSSIYLLRTWTLYLLSHFPQTP